VAEAGAHKGIAEDASFLRAGQRNVALRLLTRVVTAAFFFCFASYSSAEEFRIGYLTDSQGPGSFWSSSSTKGAQLGIEEFNAAHPETPVELVFEEHQMDIAKAVSALHSLINVKKIGALISEFSSISTAASPVALKAKIPMIYSAGATSILSSNPYSFRTTPGFDALCETGAKYWLAKGKKRIAHLKFIGEPGERCSEGLRRVTSDFIEEGYDSRSEVYPQILRMKSKKPDVFINIGLETDLINMYSTLEKLKLDVRVSSQLYNLSQSTITRHGQFLQDAAFFESEEPSEDFKSRFRKRFSDYDPVSWMAITLAYTHVKQLAGAVASCGKTDLQCKFNFIAKSPAELSFTGWGKDRVAKIGLRLKCLRGDKLIDCS